MRRIRKKVWAWLLMAILLFAEATYFTGLSASAEDSLTPEPATLLDGSAEFFNRKIYGNTDKYRIRSEAALGGPNYSENVELLAKQEDDEECFYFRYNIDRMDGDKWIGNAVDQAFAFHFKLDQSALYSTLMKDEPDFKRYKYDEFSPGKVDESEGENKTAGTWHRIYEYRKQLDFGSAESNINCEINYNVSAFRMLVKEHNSLEDYKKRTRESYSGDDVIQTETQYNGGWLLKNERSWGEEKKVYSEAISGMEAAHGKDWPDYYVEKKSSNIIYIYCFELEEFPEVFFSMRVGVSNHLWEDRPVDDGLVTDDYKKLYNQYNTYMKQVNDDIVPQLLAIRPKVQAAPVVLGEYAEDKTDKKDYVVDKPAEENPGEDDGTFIPSDIFKKIPVVPGAVAVIGAVGAAGGDPDSEKKKKAKEKSAYKMYINKNFGNTLSKGAKDQPVYARIVEVKPSGEEVDRKDMTAKIQVFSGDGSLIVTDGGMTSNGYKTAYASVPAGAETGKGQVSFRFEAEEGSFTQNVIFEIAVPAIKFFQDNLTLPAVVMDKPKYLPFAVEGMGEDYEVELEISGEDYEVEVALNDDPEAKHAFFAGIIEVNKDPAPAGIYTESWLKVKAKNSEQTVEGELKVIRMHLGLFVSANAINCYRMVKKEASGKTCKELRKEDYEAALTEFRAYLLVSDEKTYEVSQLAAFPTMKITPLDDEKDPKVKEALDAMKIEMGFVKVEDEFSVFAFRCSNGFLDSPTRYKVKLSMSQDYTYVKGEGEDAKEVTVTYTCDKEVLLRSQPVRNLTKMEDMTTFHKNDQTIGDRLTYIRMMIWENNWYDHLFPVINMIDRMEDGFSVNYGWDPYQVWKVNDVFERFERGELLGANAEPVTYGIADDLEALAAGTRSWDGWQGIVLRMSLAYMTGGASEAVLLVMDVNRAAMDYRKETGGKGTAFGYFKAGIMPVVMAAGFKFAPAIGRNIGKGAKYLAPKQSAQLAARAKRLAEIAVETGQEAQKLVGGMIPNGAKSVSGKVMNAVTEFVEKVDKYDPRISLSKADLAAKTITAGTSQARAEADSLIKQAQNAQKTLDEKILDAAGKAANNEGRVLYNDVVAAKKALQAAPTDTKLIQKYNQSLVKFKASHAAIEYGNSVSPGKDLAIRGAINADLESNLNSKLVGKMQTKLSVKYELDPKNVKFDRATANKSAGVKFGRDLDLTGKNCTMNENPKYFSQATMDECLETSTREVIAEQCGEEFAEQFAKEGQFARKMDYTACTPQHADYFKGGLDTVKVVTDLEHMGESLGKNTAKSAGQTLKYKGLHPYKEGLALEQATLKGMSDAEKLALLQELETATSGEAKALANLDLSAKAKQMLEAYGLMEEGIYQPAKYGDKIISKDWLMLKNGHPETLSSNDYLFNRLGERATGLGRANDAIRGLDQTGTRISITDTRKVLQMRGTSVEEMIENMGNNFEKLDKLAGISQDAAISDAMSNVKSAWDLAMAVKSDSQKGKKDN